MGGRRISNRRKITLRRDACRPSKHTLEIKDLRRRGAEKLARPRHKSRQWIGLGQSSYEASTYNPASLILQALGQKFHWRPNNSYWWGNRPFVFGSPFRSSLFPMAAGTRDASSRVREEVVAVLASDFEVGEEQCAVRGLDYIDLESNKLAHRTHGSDDGGLTVNEHLDDIVARSIRSMPVG